MTGMQEEVWDKIQAHKSKVRAANKPFSENRSFSSSVRDLVKKGQVEEARKQCQEQVVSISLPCLMKDLELYEHHRAVLAAQLMQTHLSLLLDA